MEKTQRIISKNGGKERETKTESFSELRDSERRERRSNKIEKGNRGTEGGTERETERSLEEEEGKEKGKER